MQGLPRPAARQHCLGRFYWTFLNSTPGDAGSGCPTKAKQSLCFLNVPGDWTVTSMPTKAHLKCSEKAFGFQTKQKPA